MKITDFRRLKSLMTLTFSENDSEALAALRAANRLLATEKLTWERVLDRSVTIVAEVEADPYPPPKEAQHPKNSDLDDLVEEARLAALEQPSGTSDFVESVAEQYERTGWLSDKQQQALKDVIDR